MPELDPVASGEDITAARENQANARRISRYQDSTDRDNKTPTPETGEPAYIIADPSEPLGILQIWNGTQWVGYLRVSTAANTYMPLTGGTFTGDVAATKINGTSPLSDGEQKFRNLSIGTAPVSATTGDLWIDTVSNPNELKRWSGSQWDTLLVSA